jgi:hypothetical protein
LSPAVSRTPNLLLELAADRPGPVDGRLGAGRRSPYPLYAPGALAQLGRKHIGQRADVLTLNTRAQGSRLGDLLASANIDGGVEGGRLVPPRAGVDR